MNRHCFAFGALAILSLGCTHSGANVAARPAVDAFVAFPDTPAPDSFTVAVVTSRGPITLQIYRAWSPHGVDRFYNLVFHHYYDSAAVFRVVPKFVAQFGLAADPRRTALYKPLPIADDTLRTTNARGTISFARGGPNSRTTQLFFNLVDNARLDTDRGIGFPPIGKVLMGMDVIDQFYSDYTVPTFMQDSITRLGTAYLLRAFPKLDYIIRMRIEKVWAKR